MLVSSSSKTATYPITVTFSPASAGAKSATLSVGGTFVAGHLGSYLIADVNRYSRSVASQFRPVQNSQIKRTPNACTILLKPENANRLVHREGFT